MTRLTLSVLLALPLLARADEAAVKAALAKPIIGQRHALTELQDYLEPLVPKVPAFTDAKEWEKYAAKLRQDILDRVVLRGEGKAWSKAKVQTELLETTPGKGYSVRKLRYEALPGMWI